MLADWIRDFCAQSEGKYKVYEGYSGRAMFGRKTIGIVVRQEQNYFETLAQLTSFLEAKLEEHKIDEQLLGPLLDELEGASVDALGLDSIVYFPVIRNYYPLEP